MTALVIMTLAVAVAGLLNGANVPGSVEQVRINFYHWTFTLAFLELFTLLVAIGSVACRLAIDQRVSQPRIVRCACRAGRVVVVLCPAITNLFVSRGDNRLPSFVPKSTLDKLESQISAHRDEIAQPTLMLSQGDDNFTGLYEALTVRLDTRGFDVVHTVRWRDIVNDDRVVHDHKVRSAVLMAVTVGGLSKQPPGKLIATANPAPGFDRDAFALLLREARSASKVVIGPHSSAG